jgi:4,5-DOPA dioxygenase extradiol
VGVDPSSTVPAAFIGHGSPMNALEANVWTAAWREFGASLPALRGVVAISAHWYVGATAVTAMDHPRTIHDFTGFPPELFAPTDVVADTAAWGLDHGTWSVLCHVLPDASVPVVQLSIDSSASWDDHVRMGSRLAPLRHDGVLIIGSGNVVHNLGRMDWGRPTGAFDWATRVDEAVRTAATRTPIDIEALGAIPATPDGALAVPTDEHYLPLAYLAGLATAARAPLRTLTGGVAFGSVSMASFVLD